MLIDPIQSDLVPPTKEEREMIVAAKRRIREQQGPASRRATESSTGFQLPGVLLAIALLAVVALLLLLGLLTVKAIGA